MSSSASSPGAQPLDSLQAHHTQALVNVVSSTLHGDPIDMAQLEGALFELRRHMESPHSSMRSHPATDTNAVEVVEHIMLCWVCARAAQADAQNYDVNSVAKTADQRFDKYAGAPEQAVLETIQCISYLVTMSTGVAVVAQTSIPTSLVLSLNFTDSAHMHTCALRALTKLCTKHSVRHAKADGRWESETGLYAVLDAFTRAQEALRLRNRFDGVATCAYTSVSEAASIMWVDPLVTPPPSGQNSENRFAPESAGRVSAVDAPYSSERVAVSALVFINALVDAHCDVEGRLRIRKELLDTPLYQCLKLLEEPEFGSSRASAEARRFRRAYTDDIKARDPHITR